MKTDVGVDSDGLYRPALNLLARLAFEGQRLHLLHVGEHVPLLTPFMPGPDELPVPQVEEAERDAGQALLQRVSREASEHGFEAEASYDVGNPAHRLIAQADAEEADLIAVGAARKGKYGSFFLGSVGRGLAIGAHQSVLVVKGEVAPTGGVRVVLATDHSEYASRCVDRLLSLRPRGIESITVVTASDAEHPEDLARLKALAIGPDDARRLGLTADADRAAVAAAADAQIPRWRRLEARPSRALQRHARTARELCEHMYFAHHQDTSPTRSAYGG